MCEKGLTCVDQGKPCRNADDEQIGCHHEEKDGIWCLCVRLLLKTLQQNEELKRSNFSFETHNVSKYI